MNNKIFFTAILFILLTGTLSSAASRQAPITMHVPVSVVSEAVAKSLPVPVDINSTALVGSVFIQKIENLQFRKDTLSSRISIVGHDLHIVTSIGGHDLRMKIGALDMRFQCDATIRYHAPSQTLFLKPVITDLQASSQNKTDVASAIVLLFNNREFPIQIDRLKPIVTNTGSKFLSISMNIEDIRLQPDNLLLRIIPSIKTSKKAKIATTRQK